MALIEWEQWKRDVEQELQDNILAYWIRHTVDEENGGFVGAITGDGAIHSEADKGLVLNARILWTFAAAYRTYGNPEYLRMAERAYDYLDRFRDAEYGGLYWMITSKGEPAETKKQVYGQAFAIYAYAEYYRATEKAEALDKAVELFETLERYAYDPQYKGYLEAFGRDWSEIDDVSLSGTDLNEKKSMNTHLHVLEAYTNLYRVYKTDRLRDKLAELIQVTADHIVDPQTHHFLLFFNEAWDVKSHEVSYGHDIEGSWLMWEAAEVLGDEATLARIRPIAVQMAQATYEEGLDSDGAVVNEADANGWTDTDKHWWPQAEAVVGFLNAYQMTGETHFLDAAVGAWRFIDRFIADKEDGEWFWKTDREGNPDRGMTKVGPWKCPYHNGRTCFEVLERIAHIQRK